MMEENVCVCVKNSFTSFFIVFPRRRLYPKLSMCPLISEPWLHRWLVKKTLHAMRKKLLYHVLHIQNCMQN